MPASPIQQPAATFKVLIVDLIGLMLEDNGEPSFKEAQAYIEGQGGRFHHGSIAQAAPLEEGLVHFFYLPELSSPEEIRREAAQGYDAVIAAATVIPEDALFPRGGVRIGAGTGNMRSASWGGGDGRGGGAPLMNTPGINSRATAQMAFKALLRVRPDLPMDALHARTVAGRFDTGRNLREVPTAKLEGQRFAVLGFGNIGQEVAKLAAAFGMDVIVYARPKHRPWIEAAGYTYAQDIIEAARGADVVSVHLGLGPVDPQTADFANARLVNAAIFDVLAPGAMVINYDRGELIDIPALDRALSSGQVGDVAVDADIFIDEQGKPTGPLSPYLPLAARYGDRVHLLPHAAADTDHPSRVAGARQAVDQILSMLRHRIVYNKVGDLPDGHIDGGPRIPPGIGGADPEHLSSLTGTGALKDLAADLATLSAYIEGLNASDDPKSYLETCGRDGTLAGTRVNTALEQLGLIGGFRS